MPLSALLLVVLLSVVPAPGATGDGWLLSSITLYDGSSGVTPDESGAAPDAPWFSFTTANTNLPSNVQENHESHGERATVNRTYIHDRPHYPALRVPSWSSWSSWLVEWLPFGSQIGRI
jgi:hypothetical protein